jgi:Lyzozyme M1 (1,4-beta-N-acetylmuramidase)
MELYGLQIARAGEFLRPYESKRYTFWERNNFLISIPLITEEFADISFWQAVMNWEEYKKHARAAILRLGQGRWEDTEFIHNYNNAREESILLGGYWFYDGRVSPLEQANVILGLLKDRYLDMELFVDWETNYGGKYEGLKNVVTLMKILDSSGLKVKDIGLYTGYYWFKEHPDLTQHDYLRNKPLWLAWWASPAVVKVPDPWITWTHWQKGTPVLQWGQPTQEIDLNVFNGTRAQFEERYTSAPIPNPTSHTVEVFIDGMLAYSKII